MSGNSQPGGRAATAGNACNSGAWRWSLPAACLALLVACAPEGVRVEEARSTPTSGGVSDRVPVLLLPGVNREVARVLRGGTLAPFSGLALPTDADALGALGDPRFPEGDGSADALPAWLDRELRGTAARGLQPLVDRLVRDEGYVRGNPDDPRDKDYPENGPVLRADRTRAGSLFVLYYDWRRDIPESACVLAERIGRIRRATGSERILLVGHSLGGVLARYYLRFGGQDVLGGRDCPLGTGTGEAVNGAGADRVDRAVFLGAPHRGSVAAFRALQEDFSLFGVLGLGLREAAFTMPMAWELLPAPDDDGRVPLLLGENGEQRVALYELSTWRERGWIAGNDQSRGQLRFVEAMLARSSAFRDRMAGAHLAEDRVRRLAVASQCRPTAARAILGQGGLEFVGWRGSDHPLAGKATVPGDGVVTAESALALTDAPTLQRTATCSRHSSYLDDPEILERVVSFLLR